VNLTERERNLIRHSLQRQVESLLQNRFLTGRNERETMDEIVRLRDKVAAL